jgi:Archaea-specific editing domain of threonyl-tRNA synthetase
LKLLTFLAQRFSWSPHSTTLEGAGERPPDGAVSDCVVVFVHAEARDETPERTKSTLDHARKHVEWLARKKEAKNVVLHSFAHLGGESASHAFGRAWMEELGTKLTARGFAVSFTPFGWTNAWDIAVHGEGFAKVWKDI